MPESGDTTISSATSAAAVALYMHTRRSRRRAPTSLRIAHPLYIPRCSLATGILPEGFEEFALCDDNWPDPGPLLPYCNRSGGLRRPLRSALRAVPGVRAARRRRAARESPASTVPLE